MPGGFPLGLEICNGNSVGANTATSSGTALTTGVSTNTKGAYAQLIASTAADAVWIAISLIGFGGSSTAGAVDIAVGGSGSEQIIISNLIASGLSKNVGITYVFPCAIPSGTRIAARCQTNQASDSMDVACVLFDGAFTQIEGTAGVDAIGFVAANTTGTIIDPGGTANTKGAYAQLTASTSKDYLGFVLETDMGSITTTAGFPQWLIDVAIGAGGSEQIIVPNLQVNAEAPTATGTISVSTPFFPIPIPSGTRVAARSQCSINTLADRTLGLTLYGIYQ